MAIAPAFIVFSLISGKQPHYLLPVVPLFVILLAVSLSTAGTSAAQWPARARRPQRHGS